MSLTLLTMIYLKNLKAFCLNYGFILLVFSFDYYGLIFKFLSCSRFAGCVVLFTAPYSYVWDIFPKESWCEMEPQMPQSWYLSLLCSLGPGIWPRFDWSGISTWTLNLKLVMIRSKGSRESQQYLVSRG